MPQYNHGFLVSNNSGHNAGYNKRYLELREVFFGVKDTYPEAVRDLGVDPQTGVPVKRLENAHLGLLMKYEDAQQLMESLQSEFPNLVLEIVCIEYPDAEYVRWETDDGYVTSKSLSDE